MVSGQTDLNETKGSAEVAPEIYELHVKVPREMQEQLKELALIAYRLGKITKPDLVDLMNLFIGWGFHVLKQTWLDRMGYR